MLKVHQQPIDIASPQGHKSDANRHINQAVTMYKLNEIKPEVNKRSSNAVMQANMYPQLESSKESLISSIKSAQKFVIRDKSIRRDPPMIKDQNMSSIESSSNNEN